MRLRVFTVVFLVLSLVRSGCSEAATDCGASETSEVSNNFAAAGSWTLMLVCNLGGELATFTFVCPAGISKELLSMS